MKRSTEKRIFGIFLIFFIIVFGLRLYGFQFSVPYGQSMEPTIHDGYSLCITLDCPPAAISKGDVVVAMVMCDDEISQPVQFLIKRVKSFREQEVYLEGDNVAHSWQGWVPVSAVRSRVLWIINF